MATRRRSGNSDRAASTRTEKRLIALVWVIARRITLPTNFTLADIPTVSFQSGTISVTSDGPWPVAQRRVRTGDPVASQPLVSIEEIPR
jgi:hypothetical protein